MFKDYSATIASLIVLIAGLFGVGEIFPKEEVSDFVNTIARLIGIIGVWWGRYRQGDVSPLGFKK